MHIMRKARRPRAQRGYSLIEVLIAMALLGTVLMGIMGLFFFGRRTVASGKYMTQAVSLGTNVLEDLQSLDKTSLRATFGLGTGAGTANNGIEGENFPNSFVRTTSTISTTTDPKGRLLAWRDLITTQNKLRNGVVTVVMTPKEDPVNAATPQMGTATIVHVRVIVAWDEAQRHRRVAFDAVKVER